jgi:hypothetical protein
MPDYDANTARSLQRRKRQLLAAEARFGKARAKPPTPVDVVVLRKIGVGAKRVAKGPKVTCGARTRAGGSCRCLALANGRCRLHGGCSTGPRTAEGRLRALEALRRYREAAKAARQAAVQ